MKARVALLVFLSAVFILLAAPAVWSQGPAGKQARAVSLGSGFTYQGLLKKNSTPVGATCDFTFSLWSVATGGSPIGSLPQSLPVSNGYFTSLPLDFGASAFDGNPRYVQVEVKCPGDTSAIPLPRQAITAAPYAQYAQVAANAWSLTGNGGTNTSTNFLGTTDNVSLTLKVNNQPGWRLAPGGPTGADTPNVIGGNKWNTVTSGVQGAVIAGGGLDINCPSSEPCVNRVTGNFGTVGGGDTNTSGAYATVGGGANNHADGGAATVGGGLNNHADGGNATVGGGSDNIADGGYATVGGGSLHYVVGDLATVGGGLNNIARGDDATVGGGVFNTANGLQATIGGGGGNEANGNYATVPGGQFNSAVVSYTLAAGHKAKANHEGAFVWADSTDADFASTGNNQFLVRAAGGMGLINAGGSVTPTAQLYISSPWSFARPQLHLNQSDTSNQVAIRLTQANNVDYRWDIASNTDWLNIWSGKAGEQVLNLSPLDATNYLYMGNNARLTAGGAWTNASDRNLKANFQTVDGQQVLARLMEVPISAWNYKAEPEEVRHIGPVAQDFHAAFGVGADDTHITTVDAYGVALAALQGLNQVVEDQAVEIVALKAENAKQRETLVAVEARLAALEQAGRGEPDATPLSPGGGWFWGGPLMAALAWGWRRGRGGR